MSFTASAAIKRTEVRTIIAQKEVVAYVRGMTAGLHGASAGWKDRARQDLGGGSAECLPSDPGWGFNRNYSCMHGYNGKLMLLSRTSRTLKLDIDAAFCMHAMLGSLPTSTFLHVSSHSWLDGVLSCQSILLLLSSPTELQHQWSTSIKHDKPKIQTSLGNLGITTHRCSRFQRCSK